MPVISRFYGISISMHFMQREHNPPHIHAKYGDYDITINFVDCEILDGYFPPKALDKVVCWMTIHREELIKMWDRQEFSSIDPLS